MITYTLRLARRDRHKDASFAIDVHVDGEHAGCLVMGTHGEILDNLLDYSEADYDTWCDVAGRDVAWLQRLHVYPAFRRRGLAKVLVSKALRRLKRTGFIGCFVTAYPLEDNLTQKQLIEFYDSVGFDVDGKDKMERMILFASTGNI